MSKKEERRKGPEIQLVIFRLQQEEFGAPIASVLEISRMLEITRIPEAPGFIEGVINLRGQVIAVVDLARQFGLPSKDMRSNSARIVIVEVLGHTVGLIVDEVPEVLRIAEEDIEKTPEVISSEVKSDYVQGVGKLGERLIVLLDLEKVLAPHEVAAAAGVATKKSEEEQKTT